MSTEDLTFEKNFLYPLYLLLIGGVISGLLIPFFNKIHETKLKRIEKEREESQKRIDREREDYRFGINIKQKILEKISDLDSWCFSKFKELVRCKDMKLLAKIHSEAINEQIKKDGEISDLISLYFKDKDELHEYRDKMYVMILDGLTLCTFPGGTDLRKKYIKKFLKEHGYSLSKKELAKSVKTELGLFEPLFKIPAFMTKFKQIILTKKIDLPHSE